METHELQQVHVKVINVFRTVLDLQKSCREFPGVPPPISHIIDILYSSPPIPTRDACQDPQWIPETLNNSRGFFPIHTHRPVASLGQIQSASIATLVL